MRLHLDAPLDTVMGWTIDFGDVKSVFDPVFKSIDHHLLNELPDLVDADAASLANWILRRTKPELPALYRIDLHETPGTGVLLADSIGGPTMPV